MNFSNWKCLKLLKTCHGKIQWTWHQKNEMENVSSWEILNELRVHQVFVHNSKVKNLECCWRFLSPFYIFNVKESSLTSKSMSKELVEIPKIGSWIYEMLYSNGKHISKIYRLQNANF